MLCCKEKRYIPASLICDEIPVRQRIRETLYLRYFVMYIMLSMRNSNETNTSLETVPPFYNVEFYYSTVYIALFIMYCTYLQYSCN